MDARENGQGENEMSICNWCDQEMMTANDCPGTRTVEYPDGVVLQSIPYLSEYGDEDKRCRDCNIELGNYHHPGCGMERCPRCNGQLVSCGCLDGEDE